MFMRTARQPEGFRAHHYHMDGTETVSPWFDTFVEAEKWGHDMDRAMLFGQGGTDLTEDEWDMDEDELFAALGIGE